MEKHKKVMFFLAGILPALLYVNAWSKQNTVDILGPYVDQTTMEVRLNNLLKNHPASEVAEFFHEIQSGEVRLIFGNIEGGFASFQVRPDTCVAEADDTSVWKQYLVVNSKHFSAASDLGNQLMLYHEYVHFSQFRSGRFSREVFNPWYGTEFSEKREWACEQKWYAEREAYQKQCKFAERLKTDLIADFCHGIGTPTFESYLTKLFLEHDPSLFCRSVWQRHLKHSLM